MSNETVIQTRDHRRIPIRALMVGFAVFAICLVAGTTVQIALAHHHRYLIDDPAYNNGGATSPWTWALHQGVVGNDAPPAAIPGPLTLKWCNQLGGYSTEVSTSFSNWEAAAPSWTQFTNNCASPQITVKYEPTSGAVCTGTGAIACWLADWHWDPDRNANYVTGGTVYLDPAAGWYANKVRAVVGHEVGHALGLSEGYIESSYGCASGPSTVMDAPFCDSISPTSSDTADVSTFFSQAAPSGQSGSDCTWWTGYRSLCVNWYDGEPTNGWQYYDAYRCNNYPTCSNVTYAGPQWHHYGSGYYLANNSAYTGYLSTSGYYFATLYFVNAAYGLGSGVNTSPVWIP